MTSRLHFDEPHSLFGGWKIQVGSRLTPGTVLLQYKAAGGNKKWRAHSFGLVAGFGPVQLQEGQPIDPGSVWVDVAECEHPVVMKDMCADCGKDLRRKDGDPGDRESASVAKLAMIHSIPELQISPDEARVHGASDEKHILDTRRLVLLVDLDQTILHTTNEHDVYHYQLYGAHSPWYHTKLRPHTDDFLKNISKLFQLHICTFGARMYAHTISKFLDPDGTLFGQRILSRDECFDSSLKAANLKALFPCGDRLVCIIDDREDVWGYAANVVHVKPYRYFSNTGDINAPPNMRKGSSEEEKECKDQDGEMVEEGGAPVEEHDGDYLRRLESILTRIHSTFYQLHDQATHDKLPDLKFVIPYVRQKVLKNVRLVFSSIIPTNCDQKHTSIYQCAIAFGATIQDNVVISSSPANSDSDKDEATTHLVAAKWGTWKVLRALESKHKVHIVRPAWLWACIQRWEKVCEEDYRLTPKDDGSDSVCPDGKGRGLSHLRVCGPSSSQQYDVADNLRMLEENELECMSAEVEDALSDDQDDSDPEDDHAAVPAAIKLGDEDSSNSEESLSNDTPRGWKRKSDVDVEPADKISRVDNEDSSSSQDGESVGSVDQDMIDALEKQFAN